MPNNYNTTVLQPLKSYPTYQFHAFAASGKLASADVFRICILETFRWMRARLQNYAELPQEIQTPDPKDYAAFSLDELHSFRYSGGIRLEVISLMQKGIWSFSLTESDMGANLGTPTERLPVLRRSFTTEITFLLHEDSVETGIRTICEEPSDCTEPCEVFRPTVVKAIAQNEQIGFYQSGMRLSSTAFQIDNSTNLGYFCTLFEDKQCNFPIVLIADSPERTDENTAADFPPISVTSAIPPGFGSSLLTDDIHVSVEPKELGNRQLVKMTEKPQVRRSVPTVLKTSVKNEKLPVFPYDRLAASLIGFAVVCFVNEGQLRMLANKEGISLSPGDAAIYWKGMETEYFSCASVQRDMEAVYLRIKTLMYRFPKRRVYDYGDAVFYAEAKLMELREKRHETNSLEERCEFYRQENAELKEQLSAVQRQNTDMQQREEALRQTRKKLKTAESECGQMQICCQALQEELSQKTAAYQHSADLIAFYRQRVQIAAEYPRRTDEVCSWLETHFSAQMIVAPRAKNEMRKYDGAMDLFMLCDGLLYLDAYTKFRRNEISEEMLLYAAENGWEVTSCGKETLRVRAADYALTLDGKRYLLDMHIKHGVSSEALMRVYFCYDETLQKIIIGSMPSHLPTVRENT